MVLAREKDGRAREQKKQGMTQRWMSIGQIQDSPRDNRAASSGNLKGSREHNKIGDSVERRPIREPTVQRELRDIEGLTSTGKANSKVTLQPAGGKGPPKAPPTGIEMPPPHRDAPGAPTHRPGRSGGTPPSSSSKGRPNRLSVKDGTGTIGSSSQTTNANSNPGRKWPIWNWPICTGKRDEG